MMLWPTQQVEVVRSKRSYHDVGDSHEAGMDFPSSEGALMTLSFLTFAVFLIKLVLVYIPCRYVDKSFAILYFQ